MVVDLESLRCFLTAADTLNFRAAARQVALSPAAFSDRIKRLEDDLDAALFVRTTRSVQLSEQGRRLLPKAQALLDDARALKEVLHDDRPLPVELTIGTRFELGLSWLLPAVRALEHTWPHLTVHLVFGDSPDLLRQLAEGRLDGVVTSSRLHSAKWDAFKLHREEYVFVASPNLPPMTSAADAEQHTLVDASPELPLFRYLLDAAAVDVDWRFARQLFVGTIAGIRQRVLAGDGVAVLPRYLVQPDLDAGTLVHLLDDQPLHEDHFRLVVPSKSPQRRALSELADDLRRHPLQ